MSIYKNLFKNETQNTLCFLWKINSFNEVVVEYVDQSIPGLVSTSRGMACLGKTSDSCFYEALNAAAAQVSDYRVVNQPGMWAYGVDSEEQLLQRLNSKSKNEAKIVWRAMPDRLRPSNVKFDLKSKQYVLVSRDA